jgi:hypothetical protein
MIEGGKSRELRETPGRARLGEVVFRMLIYAVQQAPRIRSVTGRRDGRGL